nr:phosphotransferase [Shewanella sp. Isolate11]
MSDLRFIDLQAWIARTLGTDAQILLISGDASFRRYFRVTHFGDNQSLSYIVMDSPPQLIDVVPFISLANEYHHHGILAPQVINQNPEQGFLLLSDLGDTQLLSVLNQDNVSDYYQQALQLLNTIANITTSACEPLPIYDDEFVLRELGIFTEWLLQHHLGLAITDAEQHMLKQVFQLLVDNVADQPKVGMHRDYHSRNLMLCDDQLAVIDFQDSVLGPITYDAVSLLRDCYVRWPADKVEALMQVHYQQMQQIGLLSPTVSINQYRRWFDLTGLQRHLKAAGIFCRLNYRDAKPGYMKDIPLTLRYVRDVAQGYDELIEFANWLDTKVIVPMESIS